MTIEPRTHYANNGVGVLSGHDVTAGHAGVFLVAPSEPMTPDVADAVADALREAARRVRPWLANDIADVVAVVAYRHGVTEEGAVAALDSGFVSVAAARAELGALGVTGRLLTARQG